LVGEILKEDHHYKSASELVTFFENHDMPRLQSLGANNALLDIAFVLLLTSRGIPCLYYGSEQYLHNDTDGGNDPYNRLMMDRWNQTASAYQIIQKLSRERKQNQALQWGGQHVLLEEPDLFVFMRSYREFRCLVVLNRSESPCEVKLANLNFSNGRHRCILTGFEIEIREARITFTVPAVSSLVFTIQSHPRIGRAVVHIQINGAPTKPGERLAIIGDCPELGEWDLSKAHKMECINANMWFTDLVWKESAGESIAYKYVIFSSDADPSPVREMRGVRRRAIAKNGIIKWRDVWEQ
jgi:cyclomaltodextrin glucanotransferase